MSRRDRTTYRFVLPRQQEPLMTITETEIAAARAAWADGLVAISRAYDDEGIEAARALADDLLDSLYGFEFGPVLFKPTLSGGARTFRTDKAGTLSYFVGHDSSYPQDTGFGIKSWREVRSETSASVSYTHLTLPTKLSV